MTTQRLFEHWTVREELMSRGPEHLLEVTRTDSGWMPAPVPGDVRTALIDAGRIKDPVEGLESFESEWVEERSWWYRSTFDAQPEVLKQDLVELVFESIDGAADIFLNGRHIGSNRSAHYPFTAEVKELLQPSGNELVVRVTVGAEKVNQEQAAPFKASVSKTYRRGDERRVFLRKPQYVFGWDWGPRIATCGLVKDVYLRGASRIAARGCSVHTTAIGKDEATLHVVAEIDLLHDFQTCEGSVHIALTPPAGKGVDQRDSVRKQVDVLLSSGLNYVEFDVTVKIPRLWWPNGMGSPNLYTVALSVSADGRTDSMDPFRIGIRTLELDTSPIGDGERMFRFVVNGLPVFCKGGNWIPADSVYARVTDAKYETLIAEAAEANFTILRIWGGGIYERDVFYETCDRMGILVWHDFMFACALYPDDREWFRREAEREIDYQTRRLRTHACIAVWSGNNENHWGFRDWWIGERQAEFAGGARVYNQIAPKVVQDNCPYIPYWRSSPYGGADPNGNDVGDRHHWHDCTMNPDMQKRITPEEYDKVTSKFVSEYGYIGPCAKATIEDYHAGEPVKRFSELWNWHNNTFEKDTVVAGITKHYIDAEALSLDDYLLYAGLVQGLMYGYSLESIRRTDNCWGSIFWMYNDCWGEVGWTIIDYYLRRKPSYYYVKRTFSPVKLILRRNGTKAMVYGANDTATDVDLEVEYGYAAFDGSKFENEKRRINLPAASKGPLFEFDLSDLDEKKGTYFVRPTGKDDTVTSTGLTTLLRSGPFRELEVAPASLTISDFRNDGDGCRFTVSSDVFAHAVHFGIEEEYRLSDSFFDLLPSESREVRVLGKAGPIQGAPAAAGHGSNESRDVSAITPETLKPRSVTVH